MDSNYGEALESMASPSKVSANLEEDAVKYLALAILFTLTVKAGKLSIKLQDGTTQVKVTAGGEKSYLPVPSLELALKVVEIVRSITHIDSDRGELPLSLGLPNGRVEPLVKIKRAGAKESVKFVFS